MVSTAPCPAARSPSVKTTMVPVVLVADVVMGASLVRTSVAPTGSVSVMLTPVATDVPVLVTTTLVAVAEPALERVNVYVTSSSTPADDGLLCLLSCSCGCGAPTTVVAVAGPAAPPLDDVATAWFWREPCVG